MPNIRVERHWIPFQVDYDDGSVDYFQIDPGTLNRGDHVVRTIAREHQEKGLLKPGKIIRVYRYKPPGSHD